MSVQLTDAVGDNWVIRITNEDLIDCSADTGLSLEQMMSNSAAMLRLLWYPCRKLANARRISRGVFFRERMTTQMLARIMEAMAQAMAEAFPQSEEAEADAAPLADAWKSAI